MNPTNPNHSEIANLIVNGVAGEVRSISIIGSYLIDESIREGSDIDLIVAVRDLGQTTVNFGDVFYKDVAVKDSMGERREVNTKLSGTTLDITVIDRFNTPNNPLTDGYENAIGSCLASLPIYGSSLREVFDLDGVVANYGHLQKPRQKIVDEKIASTKRKITEQGRTDLHILHELQKYTYIRECIGRGIFNRLGIKHPTDAIPDFTDVFESELAECGIALTVNTVVTL